MRQLLIKTDKRDNVATSVRQLYKGDLINVQGQRVTVLSDIAKEHKVALSDIRKGDPIIKFGSPILRAKTDIRQGDLVHIFNSEDIEETKEEFSKEKADRNRLEFDHMKDFSLVPIIKAYKDQNGNIGIRRCIWAVDTTGKDLSFPGIYVFRVKDSRTIKNISENPNLSYLIVVTTKEEKAGYESDFTNNKKIRVVTEDEDITPLRKELQAMTLDKGKHTAKLSDISLAIITGENNIKSSIISNLFISKVTDTLLTYGCTILIPEIWKYAGARNAILSRCMTKESHDKIQEALESYEQKGRELTRKKIFTGLTSITEQSLGELRITGSYGIRGILEEGERPGKYGLYLQKGEDAMLSAVLSGASVIIASDDEERSSYPLPTIKITSDRENRNADFNANDVIYEEDEESLLPEFLHYYVSILGERSLTDNEKK